MSATENSFATASPSPDQLHLFYDPPGTLRLTIGTERSFPTVRVYLAAPLSRPDRYIVLQDGKGEEIAMVDALESFPAPVRPVITAEIQRRYLTAVIESVPSVRVEFGVTYWHVGTNKGERDFVVQSLSESCTYLSPDHVLINDADGNRFEIPSIENLDPASRAEIARVL